MVATPPVPNRGESRHLRLRCLSFWSQARDSRARSKLANLALGDVANVSCTLRVGRILLSPRLLLKSLGLKAIGHSQLILLLFEIRSLHYREVLLILQYITYGIILTIRRIWIQPISTIPRHVVLLQLGQKLGFQVILLLVLFLAYSVDDHGADRWLLPDDEVVRKHRMIDLDLLGILRKLLSVQAHDLLLAESRPRRR